MVIGVIPCRYNSTRFPGKPLEDINGMPMMWHVYQRCIESKVLDEIYIATDDERILAAAKELGLDVIMTRNEHKTGTDRVSEVASKVDFDIYVNIQGDEPLLDPASINRVVTGLIECDDSNVMASNAYALIDQSSDVVDTNVVKVIISVNGNAMAYSRQPIPYPKSQKSIFYKQLGLYAFKKNGLRIYAENEPGYVEQTEGIEMYRLIELGYDVRMIRTSDNLISVDTPNDLRRVNKIIVDSKL